MPKTLILLRHAKSAWPDGVADSQRPLAKRGRRDAPAAGRWLRERDLAPEIALVSSARRAVETFELVAAELPVRPRETVTDAGYGASVGDLLDLVRGLTDDVVSALVVGHNPGIGRLADILDESERSTGAFPTSALAVFDVGGHWAGVDPGAARLVAFAVPRG
ncbi:MAG TPA: histidine phosphatase family protein [Jiangellaceae bacterium]|nr:histidine phosphatase family protein [Jiangellaceae bacterium]